MQPEKQIPQLLIDMSSACTTSPAWLEEEIVVDFWALEFVRC